MEDIETVIFQLVATEGENNALLKSESHNSSWMELKCWRDDKITLRKQVADIKRHVLVTYQVDNMKAEK